MIVGVRESGNAVSYDFGSAESLTEDILMIVDVRGDN